jgi:dihydrofolate reductase
MRRVVVDTLISLDGYFAGPNNELDWFVNDEQSMEWSRDILRGADLILYGRVTYEGMAEYWTSAAANDPYITRRLNETSKIVFSHTMRKAAWRNSTVVHEEPAEYVRRTKRQSGKDMVVLGSSTIVSSLLDEDLIDEFRIRVQPVVLGAGRPLFSEQKRWHHLTLRSAKGFRSGVVALHYQLAD